MLTTLVVMSQVHFSFWRHLAGDAEVLAPGDLLDPESVLLNNKLYITGVSASGAVSDLLFYDLETELLVRQPIKGRHPATDGNSLLYLLTLQEDSDFRYQVVEFDVEASSSSLLETTGIAPKERKGRVSSIWHQGYLYFFGGFQMYKGDATGSFVYQLCIETREWTTIDYSGNFPASNPHAPFTGCRAGHSTILTDDRIIIFGGTLIENSLLNAEYLTSSVFDNINMNDMYELDLVSQRWKRLQFKSIACIVPPMTEHSAALHGSNMLVYYEGKIYRFDLKSHIWTLLKQSLKAPPIRNTATIQVHRDALYLFGHTSAGPGFYRLNLRKAAVWTVGDKVTDYSGYFNQENSADLVVKVQNSRFHVHRKVLEHFSPVLKKRFERQHQIKSVSLDDLPADAVQVLFELLYRDLAKDLPREPLLLMNVIKAAILLGVREVEEKAKDFLVVSAANMRLTLETLGEVPWVQQLLVDYLKTHLREAALILRPEQLSMLLTL